MKTEHENESTDWNDAMLAHALAEVHGERPPDLAAAILARTGHGPRPRAARATVTPGTRSWAAAALVALSAGAVFAVAFAARDVSLSQGTDKRLVPLDPGATWLYGVDRQGTATELTQRVMTVFPVQLTGEKEPRNVGQLLVQDGGANGFEYLALDARGVFRAGSMHWSMLPTLDAEASMTRLVALPVGSENRWETEEQQWRSVAGLGGGRGGGAGAGGAGGPGGGGAMRAAGGAPGGGGAVVGRNQRILERRRVELVAPTVAVRVPAGEFQAVHVRMSVAAAEGAQVVEQLWLAAGTGIVKRVLEQDGKAVETVELRKFTPGAPDADPKTVLARFLQRDAGVTEFGAVQSTEWIAPAPSVLRLRGSFAVVSFAEQKKAFWILGSTVTPFDMVDAEQWTAVVRDEGMTGWNDGILPQARCRALGDLATRLCAAQRGWKVGKETESSSFRTGPDGASSLVVSRCVDAAGAAQRLTTKFAIGSDDRVGKVEFPE